MRHTVALVALLVALSGSSYAADAVATKLMPRNSVGSAQVINGSLQKVDFSKKTIAALKGARGARGDPPVRLGRRASRAPRARRATRAPPARLGSLGRRGCRDGPTGLALLRSAPGANVVTTVDSAGDITGTSATIGADGLGLISYYDYTNNLLKIAHCDNAACTTATKTTLDSLTVGLYTSVTIGTDGLGLVSYHASSATT